MVVTPVEGRDLSSRRTQDVVRDLEIGLPIRALESLVPRQPLASPLGGACRRRVCVRLIATKLARSRAHCGAA